MHVDAIALSFVSRNCSVPARSGGTNTDSTTHGKKEMMMNAFARWSTISTWIDENRRGFPSRYRPKIEIYSYIFRFLRVYFFVFIRWSLTRPACQIQTNETTRFLTAWNKATSAEYISVLHHALFICVLFRSLPLSIIVLFYFMCILYWFPLSNEAINKIRLLIHAVTGKFSLSRFGPETGLVMCVCVCENR